METRHIAALDLTAIYTSGARTPVAIRVGAPEQVATGEWRCVIRLDGVHDGLMPAHGDDSMQALCLALGLAAALLRDFVARGGRLLCQEESAGADDESDWPMEAYFGWLGPPR